MAITREAFDRLAGDGKIASAEFIKKDGSLRKMVFRTKVTKGVTGEGMKYDPTDYGLRTVFDMQKGAFRHINLETLISVRAKGKVHLIKPEPLINHSGWKVGENGHRW